MKSKNQELQTIQPEGLWKRRKAPSGWIELALDSFKGKKINFTKRDLNNYNVWHYWAYSKNASKTWSNLRPIIGHVLDNEVANNGEHPLHRLILSNNADAFKLWINEAKTSINPLMNMDTLWHSIAWTGNIQLLNELAEYIDINLINEQDDCGYTPAIIACHRGNLDFLKQFLYLGCDPNITDENNKTLLHHVAFYGDLSVYTEIQDFGASEDIRSDKNLTPNFIIQDKMKNFSQSDILSNKLFWLKKMESRLLF